MSDYKKELLDLRSSYAAALRVKYERPELYEKSCELILNKHGIDFDKEVLCGMEYHGEKLDKPEGAFEIVRGILKKAGKPTAFSVVRTQLMQLTGKGQSECNGIIGLFIEQECSWRMKGKTKMIELKKD